MRNGLLQDPQLAEIETKLNEGRLDDAQRLLAALPDAVGAESERAYFATRLLFERGRLDRSEVAERLRELLNTSPPFPEAERMLRAAESGSLSTARRGEEGNPAPPTEHAAPPSSQHAIPSLGEIPRAPPLPRFAPDLDAPSYSPPGHPSPGIEEEDALLARDTELSPPPPPPPRGAMSLEIPRRPPEPLEPLSTVPRVPSLELPAQRSASTRPVPRGSLNSTIPSPDSPPSSRFESQRPARAPQMTPQDVARALERGKARDAITLAESAEPSPELALLKARAFARVGEMDNTELELGRLLRAPLLEPSLRSATARFLLELGHPERALEQARRALSEDPKDPGARVTCAWALLRVQQCSPRPGLAAEAEPLLSSVRVRDPDLAAVLPALRAWISVQKGDPSRALSLSQSALAQDPNQPDALSALAIASAKLGFGTEAESALQKLREVAPSQADTTRASLRNAGLMPEPSERFSTASEADVAALFGDAETALVHGRPELAILGFERACQDRLRSLSRRGGAEAWPPIAAAAARLFTELPVLRHFAPFDCSLFGIERLSAAFDVLYGASGRTAFGDEGTILLAGAYFGDSLRQAFGGEWHGSPDQPRAASIEAIGMSIHPCEAVARSLREREPLTFEAPPHLHPGADPLGNTVPLSLVPPAPWDPEPWPALHRISELGRLLPQSVVGAYCARVASRLDHSVSSVAILDRYVTLLAPPKAPPALEAGWTRRVAVLLGAYLGEVLIRALGARWLEQDRPDGPAAYRIALRDGSQTTPVARALDRLSGRRAGPLSDYVSRIVGGRASLPVSGRSTAR